MVYGYVELKTAADWAQVVGAKNWKQGYSAYELAQAWASGNFPAAVQAVLNSVPSPFPKPLTPDYMLVEKPVFLDNHKAPSMTDIMVYCNMKTVEPFVLAVEGKANEAFDKTVADWILDGTAAPKPTRVHRLDFLRRELGVDVPEDSTLRYQLIHRSVSALLESGLHGEVSCMLLIHSFGGKTPTNWTDYVAFLNHIGIANPVKNVVSGPVKLGQNKDKDFYAAWIE